MTLARLEAIRVQVQKLDEEVDYLYAQHLTATDPDKMVRISKRMAVLREELAALRREALAITEKSTKEDLAVAQKARKAAFYYNVNTVLAATLTVLSLGLTVVIWLATK